MSFLDVVNEFSGIPPTPLPLVHITNAYWARSILEEKNLSPRPCKIYGEELLYFFYGRASYVSKGETTSNPANYPIALIIKCEAAESSVRRISALDTGAFYEDLYKSYLPNCKKEDFELGNEIIQARKAIARFFLTNEKYIKERPLSRSEAKISTIQYEAASYLDLISSTQDNALDDRRSAIEVQTQKTIELKPTSVEAIVYPDVLDDDPGFNNLLAPIPGLKKIVYTAKRASREKLHGFLQQKAEDYLLASI